MSQRVLRTWLLPELMTPEDLTEGVAVVIDILRASSTICTALANGADRVIPCLQVDDALQAKNSFPKEKVILGGERKGVMIPEFDHSNSPKEYTSEKVNGKTLLFTTTNGTKALLQCQQAERVTIGSFLNLSAVCNWLKDGTETIHLVCAGTNGEVTQEDCLFAGAVASSFPAADMDDATRLCLNLYENCEHQTELEKKLLDSQGGKNLTALDLQEDVLYCAQRNQLDVVPIWNSEENQIHQN